MLENCHVSLKGAGFEAKLNEQGKGQRVLYPQDLPEGLRNSEPLWCSVSSGLGRIRIE